MSDIITAQIITQTDLEETKAQEIAKLQDALEVMQKKVDEANALVVKEREAAKKAIEEAPPVIKETPVYVEDTKKVESLMEENRSLKVIQLTRFSFCCGAEYDNLLSINKCSLRKPCI